MTPHSCSGLRVHPQVRRSAGMLLALVFAFASSSPAFCDEIHDAARKGDLAKVQELLKQDPTLVSSREIEGQTPLHFAAASSRTDVAAFLLASKAEVDARDSFGKTPLHRAASFGSKEIAQLLLSNKADVNARDNTGWTPLHIAALFANVPFVEFLLANGADVNIQSNEGHTALHYAKHSFQRADLIIWAQAKHVDSRRAGLWEKTCRDTIEKLLREHGGRD